MINFLLALDEESALVPSDQVMRRKFFYGRNKAFYKIVTGCYDGFQFVSISVSPLLVRNFLIFITD
jgi:hypothetical protein